MSESRPNLRRRMGSFVAKPEPGELLFLHKFVVAYHFIMVCIIIIIVTFEHKI